MSPLKPELGNRSASKGKLFFVKNEKKVTFYESLIIKYFYKRIILSLKLPRYAGFSFNSLHNLKHLSCWYKSDKNRTVSVACTRLMSRLGFLCLSPWGHASWKDLWHSNCQDIPRDHRIDVKLWNLAAVSVHHGCSRDPTPAITLTWAIIIWDWRQF